MYEWTSTSDQKILNSSPRQERSYAWFPIAVCICFLMPYLVFAKPSSASEMSFVRPDASTIRSWAWTELKSYLLAKDSRLASGTDRVWQGETKTWSVKSTTWTTATVASKSVSSGGQNTKRTAVAVEKKKPVVLSVTNKKPIKRWASSQQQQYIDYAWELSHDPKFIYTLEAENGLWSIDRQSTYRDKNGRQEPSFGFCQIHKGYHPEIVNDQRFFTDWKWQLETCWRLYKWGTAFYGKNNIARTQKNFDWM